jgi:hypothetical protein
MTENMQDIVLKAARGLLDHIAEPANSQLKELLEGAETDINKRRKIYKLLCEYEYVRDWMDRQISMPDATKGDALVFSSVPGEPDSVLATHRWVCPKNKHDHWMFVMQEGERPPLCKIHNVRMEREHP